VLSAHPEVGHLILHAEFEHSPAKTEGDLDIGSSLASHYRYYISRGRIAFD